MVGLAVTGPRSWGNGPSGTGYWGGGLRRENRPVPILPNGIEGLCTQDLGDLGGGAMVVDFELGSGALAGVGSLVRFEIDAAAPEGAMEVVGARTGVSAGFGVGPGRDVGNAEGEEAVAEGGGFASGEDDADLREGEAKGADELNEIAVGEGEGRIGTVAVIAGVGTQARKGDRELRLPAVLVEILEVGGEGEGFAAPVGQSEEGSDPDATKAAGVGPLGAL